MASVDNLAELKDAQAIGWKTFRVKEVNKDLTDKKLYQSEIICKAERDKYTNCITCKLCDGSKVNVAVTVHGTHWKTDRFNLLIKGEINE